MPGIAPVPGLSAGFLQIGVSAFTMHDQAVPPVPPAPVPLPSIPGLIEGPAFMGWPPGGLSHKKGTKTQFDGNPAVQYSHDIGFLIPHFAIPMNALCAVNTVFSKHKVMFPVSKVMIEGQPLGTYLFFLLGGICCNPVSLPTGVVILLKCTVWTAMSFADLAIGLITAAFDAAFDWVMGKIFPTRGGTSKLPMQVLGGLTFKEMVTEGGGKLVARWVGEQIAREALPWALQNLVIQPLTQWAPNWGAGQIPGAPPWLGDQRPGVGMGNWGPPLFNKDWSWAGPGGTTPPSA